MSPPINLPDGTEVAEVILPDGATASEVVAPDGSTVFSVIPDSVVEDFERDNPLNDYGGDTGAYSETQTNVFEGTDALFSEPNNPKMVSSTAGLPTYPQTGDVFSCRIRLELTSPNGAIFWATQSEDGAGSISGYQVLLVGETDELRLRRYDTGSASSLDSTSITNGVPQGEYLTIRISEWDSNGNITAKLVQNEDKGQEQQGNELASVSATDKNYSSGGIGFWWNTSGSANGQGRFDYYIIEERA